MSFGQHYNLHRVTKESLAKTKANVYLSSQTAGHLGIYGRVSIPYATLLFYMLFHSLGLLSSLTTNLQLVQVS